MSKILYSKDYNKFKVIEGTKIFNDNIYLKGEVDPIIVNKDMYIIDGVHRFIALKNEGIEVPYIIK